MRDITSFTGEGWLKDDDVVSLLKSDSYQSFWENLQGGAPPNNFENNFMGVHTGMSDSHKLERLLADYGEQLVSAIPSLTNNCATFRRQTASITNSRAVLKISSNR